MPFDERVHVALRALERPIAEFRTTIEGALAQAEGYLAMLERDPVARAERVRHELGKFAAGRSSVLPQSVRLEFGPLAS